MNRFLLVLLFFGLLSVNKTQAETEYRGGKLDNSGDGNYYEWDDASSVRGLVFSAKKEFVLKSVKVYNQQGESANRTFTVKKADGTVVNSVSVFVPEGESRLEFNMTIPAGDYTLFADVHKGLYKNNGSFEYPYDIGGVVSITASDVGADYYYFFYDWLISVSDDVPVISEGHPYPNHTDYQGTHIKPNNYTQQDLDSQTKQFYDQWKAEYLKNDCSNSNEYYVFSGGDAINVSEAQGYGMMITAYFSGYDANAQTYFDGLYRFYKSHPSNINSNLMDWQQLKCDAPSSSDDDAASDGDIDIAFGLLLADAQWGSSGSINYMSAAKDIINAIMQDEVNQNTWTVKLGDWCDADDSKYYYSTRPSDFIMDHFRVFAEVTKNQNWDKVTDKCYSLISDMQTNYSSTAGLLPDFIINTNTSPKPAGANFLEDKNDGNYYYNSCRTPWRIGTDFLISGNTSAKNAVVKINGWLKTKTGSNVDKISNGYKLDGTPIYDWNDPTFVAPFAVGAMADVNNQDWLNSLYANVVSSSFSSGDYFSNTIKLLSMLVISGNYWVPDYNIVSINKTSKNSIDVNIYPTQTRDFINIELKDIQPNEQVIAKIVDIRGKVLVDNIKLYDSNRLNIGQLKEGMYFLCITVDNKAMVTNKIVKIN